MAKLKHKTYHATSRLAERYKRRESKFAKLKMLEALTAEYEARSPKDRKQIKDLHRRLHNLRTQIKVLSTATYDDP
jgi:hypothetical protein